MKRRDGFALIVALLIGMVTLLLVLGAAVTGLIDRGVSSNQQRAETSYYIAKAGLDRYKTIMFHNLVDYYNAQKTGWCQSPLLGGIKDGNGNVILAPSTWSGRKDYGQGWYQVRYEVLDNDLVLTSVGHYGDGQSTIQLVASAGGGPTTAWYNAIFANGQAGGAINGNVSVYGSVHIVSGDLQLPTDFSTSGSAGVYNTYVGNNGQNNSDISAYAADVTGSSSADLCARLKIAKGNVFLQGSSALGASGEPIYSVNLGNGNIYNESPTSNPNPSKQITSVSDSHLYLQYPTTGSPNSGYKGYSLDFPTLSDSFGQGSNNVAPVGYVVDPNTNGSCSWLEQNGTFTLPPTNPNTDYTGCGNAKGTISWIADGSSAGGHLKISGTVDFPANLDVNADIKYAGRGTVQVGADKSDTGATVTMTGSLRPLDSGGFPDTDMLAFVTPGTLDVSLQPSNYTAFAAYAGTSFTADKQSTIFGSIVANEFDLGNQVPKIAYVPELRLAAENLCLPGTFCDQGKTQPNPGVMSNISIERR